MFDLNKIKENIDKGISEGLSKAKYSADITCPFCKEDDFDLKGLKYHLLKYCKEYAELRDL